MPPLYKALLFCGVVGSLVLALFVGYLSLRSITPAADASLARYPDIIQMEWRKRSRTEKESRERALATARECVANGERYCLMENFPAALREYTKAVTLDGANLQACLEVGRVAWHLGDRPAALQGWQKAITLNPLAASAHGGLFEVYQGGSEKDRQRAFRHALTLMVLSPHRTATREFVVLNPEIARQIQLVADDADEPLVETDQRKLLTTAWQALPKHDSRTADTCFARVLALRLVAAKKPATP
ncbi:MAG: hypothetical protein HN904_15675 [Victivallales bacterium]|nr:hypothetical protein [Victivallales bacterium]